MIDRLKWCGIVLAVVYLAACRPALIPPPPDVTPPPAERPESPAPAPAPSPETVENELHRRNQVATALTTRGRRLMETGQVDAAIRLFEQALSQSPHHGAAYFYLAEAWLRKDSVTQARAFHDQAALYLRDEPAWQNRLKRQNRTIVRRLSELVIP
jgi:tetratricopeptide (TPR) repeat protein